jgi:hypothetical protein
MKKIVFVLILAVIITTGTVFADHPDGLGIGIVGFYPGGAGLSLKIPGIPVFWAVSAGFGENELSMHLTGDSYIFDKPLVKDAGLHWFLGIGGWFSYYNYTKEYFASDYSYTRMAFGARIPIGLSWQPIPLLEIFADIAPSLGFYIDGEQKFNDSVIQDGDTGFAFYWPIELGIRLWL